MTGAVALLHQAKNGAHSSCRRTQSYSEQQKDLNVVVATTRAIK